MVVPVPAQISKVRPRRPAAPLRRRSLLLLTTHHPQPTLFLSALCFHILTNCFSRNPFILTTIRIAPGGGGTSLQSPSELCASVPLPAPTLSGWQIHCFQAFAASFPSLCAPFCTPSLCFQSFAASFPKTPGWGVSRVPASSLRPSETVARTHRCRMSLLLVPSYFAALNRFCIPSPIVPVPPPSYTPLRFRRLSFERVRTPHHTALSNAPSAYRPLDDWCRGWRNQHGIAGRQLSRGLLLPG
jgi:hypothetical protein